MTGPSSGGVCRDDLDECWCCDGLHDSPGLLCPNCDDAGCQYFDGECRSDHKPVLPDGGQPGHSEPAVEREEWPGILMCVPCEQYVDADRDAEETACGHSWDEATDISDLDGEEWAKLRHDIYIKELEREEPRNREMVVSELASLMWDLTSAEVLPDDYDDREGLEKLLVSDS